MAKDTRQLREEAAAAAAAGKYKRALEHYLEIERTEPADAQWPKRAAEMLRRLGKTHEAIAAYERAVDRYAAGGFLVQAIAVCKLILQIDPNHSAAIAKLAAISGQQDAGPSRLGTLAESHRSLHGDPMVDAIRRARTTGQEPALPDPGAVAAPGDTGAGARPATRPPPVATLRPPTSPPASATRPVTTPPPVAAEPAPAPRRVLRPTARPVTAPPARSPDEPRSSTLPMPPITVGPSAPPGPVAGRVPPPAPPGPGRVPPPAPPGPGRVPPPVPPRPPPVPPRPVGSATGPAKVLPPPTAAAAPPALEPSAAPTRAKPVTPVKLRPGAPLAEAALADAIAGSHQFDETSAGAMPGVVVIPLDDALASLADDDATPAPTADFDSIPIEITHGTAPALTLPVDDVDERSDVAVDDLDDVPLAELRVVSAKARRALAGTPLFAGLEPDALESLVQQLELVHVGAGEVLFREGDAGDALYVISEGEVIVQSEGPPRVEMSRLGTGAFFGEVSLVTDQPRSATVVTATASELLRISRAVLARILDTHPEVLRVVLRFVRDRLVDRLVRTSPLFRPFAAGEAVELASRFRFLEIEPGAVILRPGARADGLYIVLAGRAEVQRDGGSVFPLGPGDLIGETSLLGGEKVSSPVVAVSKCLALCLPSGQFHELIMTYPHVLEYVGEQAESRRKVQMM
ncbi:MAG: cyclic nucleotide-binding domain-containing protein [Kofleriaceae bacterium]|nr:cyclic nucleotide-binding domain-containing protein [Kofleriaceae bacterium]